MTTTQDIRKHVELVKFPDNTEWNIADSVSLPRRPTTQVYCTCSGVYSQLGVLVVVCTRNGVYHLSLDVMVISQQK